MYRFYVILLLVTLPCIALAQIDTIYFNIHWKKTVKDSASYFRTVQLQPDGRYYAQDHYLNGHLQMTGYYSCLADDDNSCRNGKFIFYDSLGFVEHEEQYANNIKQGIWRYYYPHSDNLAVEENFPIDTSRMQIIFYDSIVHNKIGEGYFLHNQKDSLWQEYYPYSGSLKYTAFFKENMREGPYTEYDAATHTMTIKGKFLHDKRTGAWGYYNTSGVLYMIVNFQDDLEEGPITYYDTISQKKRVEFNFHNGRKEGKATISYPNGYRSIDLNFNNDKLNGDQTFYYLDGNVERIEHYENGVLTSGKCFDESGARIPYFTSESYILSAFSAFRAEPAPDEPTEGSKATIQHAIKPFAKNDTTYYSIDDQKTIWDYADYYRVVYANPTDTGYKIEERYIIRNRLKFSAYVNDPDSFVYNGPFLTFDKKGYKDEEKTFDHGRLTGVSKWYFPGTDTLWMQTNFGKNNDYTLVSYYRDGKIKRMENGLLDSKNIDGVCYDENGKKIPYTPFRIIAIPSVDVNDFLNHNLHYPEDARDNGIQGRVVLKFVVLKDGTISKIHVIHGIGGGCDEEAMRVLAKMPKWKPCITDDKPSDMYYTLPITFKLE